MPYLTPTQHQELPLRGTADNDRLRLALDDVGRQAMACWMDMQGRIVDDEHRRAHGVLASIVKAASAALGQGEPG